MFRAGSDGGFIIALKMACIAFLLVGCANSQKVQEQGLWGLQDRTKPVSVGICSALILPSTLDEAIEAIHTHLDKWVFKEAACHEASIKIFLKKLKSGSLGYANSKGYITIAERLVDDWDMMTQTIQHELLHFYHGDDLKHSSKTGCLFHRWNKKGQTLGACEF